MTERQFGDMNRKNMEAAMQLAQLSIEHSKRVMALQTELARDLFDESASNAKEMSSAKGAQDLAKLRANYARRTAEKMLASAQRITEVSNDVRIEFSRLLNEQMAADRNELLDSLQSFFDELPGQNPEIKKTMQQALASATKAFEQIAQVSSTAFGNQNIFIRKSARETNGA